MLGIRRSSLVKIALFALVLFGALSASTGSAAAWCGVHTGNQNSLAGLIVEMDWIRYSDGARIEARGIYTRIWTDDPRLPPWADNDASYGNIMRLNSSNLAQNGQGVNDGWFGQYDSGCGDGHNTVFGYDQTSSRWTGSSWQTGPWALDCDISQLGTPTRDEREFHVTGIGVPNGARSGGSWQTINVRPPNGFTTTIRVAYVEPPPPTTPGTVATRSSVNGQQAVAEWAAPQSKYVYLNPDQLPTFTHWVYNTNYGGRDHAIDVYMQRLYSTQNGASQGWTDNHHGWYVFTAGRNNTDVTIWGPSTVGPNINGSKVREVCQRLRINDGGGAVVAGANPGPHTCARYREGDTSASSSVTPSTVEPGSGESVALTGSTSTTGFYDWGGSTEDNYPVTCNWVITGATAAQLGGQSTSGNCNHTIDGNGSTPVVARTYTPPASVPIGTRVCLEVTISAAAGLVGTASSEQCTTVAAKPYLKVVGGDVFAGKGFAPTTQACTATATARIVSWNRSDVANNGQWRGAGTTYAAYATGTIDGFASSQFAPGTAATPYPNEPKGLTFANVASTGTWGGSYQGATCIPDYYGTRPSMPTGTTWLGWYAANADASLSPDGTATYNVSGSLTLGGTGTSPIAAGTATRPGSSILLYVSGNVYINGDIIAETPSIPDGATNAALWLPNFLLVATGNIYIDNDVTRLYGSFAAQPTAAASSGNAYTCANGNGSPLNLSAANYGSCNRQLVVTGGIAAKKLYLLRTYGSLSRDVNGGQTVASTGSTGYTSAAEVFAYNPTLWLRRLTGTSGGSSGGTTYDAMTTLPPVL